MTKRPNLFLVGAPKCGTTAWVHYLSRHPDIYFSPMKEPHHFCTDFPNYCWAKTREEYLDHFRDAGSEKFVGEASVMYLHSRTAAREIAHFAPDAKILIFLRPQRQFLPSYHQQMLYNLEEDETDLAYAWARSGLRTDVPATCREARFLDYKSAGQFCEQVERYCAHFPSDQIKIISFADWVHDPRSEYLEILEFLGLPDDGAAEFSIVNPAHDHRSRMIAKLTQRRPPPWAIGASRLVRKFPGLGSVRPAHVLRQINRVDRYKTVADKIMLSEIDRYYLESNRRLDSIAGRELRLSSQEAVERT